MRSPTPDRNAGRPSTLRFLSDHRVLLAMIFLAALALRLTYLAEIRSTPFFTGLVADQVSYDAWAQEIASGKLLCERVFYQEPAYPYFLAPIYSILGHNLAAVYVIQALLSSLAVFIIYGIGRRSFNDPRVGLLAAAFWAGYKVEFFFIGQVLKVSLTAFILSAALWLTLVAGERKKPGWTAASGLCWGLLLLLCGAFYLAAPLVIFWLISELKGLPRRNLGALAAWLFSFGLMPGLSMLHNYAVSGGMVVTTAQGGTNFYLANFKGNPWGTSVDPPFSRRIPGQELADFKAEAEQREGRAFTDAEVSNYWFQQALREMAEDPKLAVLRVLRKFLILTNRHELTPNLSYDFFQKHYSFLLKLPLPAFWLAGPLGFAGLLLALRRRESRLLTLYMLGYSSSLLIFYSYGRFRHPLVPALLVFAAYFTTEGLDAARKGERGKPLALLALVAALSGLAFPRWRQPSEDQTWKKICYLHFEKGEYPEAIEACRQALALNPELTGARSRLAQALEQRLRFDEAEAEYREALRLEPDSAWLHYRLGKTLEAKGDAAGAAAEYRRAAELGRETKASAGQ